MSSQELAREATRSAARLRAEMGIRAAQPICPYDIADALGITVRFEALPSLEGMYSPGEPPAIVLTSLRPAGRRRFTCAHEIGHHVFNHGYRLDEVNPGRDRTTEREEFLADRFAAALLMPKLAVENAFVRRGASAAAPTADEVFLVAQDLGVGFTTLLDHMAFTLHLIGRAIADQLRKTQLTKLRATIAGSSVLEDLFPIDAAWGDRPLDVEIGDELLLPKGAEVNGAGIRKDGGRQFAHSAGEAEISIPGRQQRLRVRIARREFSGLAQYRYLEDCDD